MSTNNPLGAWWPRGCGCARRANCGCHDPEPWNIGAPLECRAPSRGIGDPHDRGQANHVGIFGSLLLLLQSELWSAKRTTTSSGQHGICSKSHCQVDAVREYHSESTTARWPTFESLSGSCYILPLAYRVRVQLLCMSMLRGSADMYMVSEILKCMSL
jgi:hypothetical protein